jgi:hypothetical protein
MGVEGYNKPEAMDIHKPTTRLFHPTAQFRDGDNRETELSTINRQRQHSCSLDASNHCHQLVSSSVNTQKIVLKSIPGKL